MGSGSSEAGEDRLGYTLGDLENVDAADHANTVLQIFQTSVPNKNEVGQVFTECTINYSDRGKSVINVSPLLDVHKWGGVVILKSDTQSLWALYVALSVTGNSTGDQGQHLYFCCHPRGTSSRAQ